MHPGVLIVNDDELITFDTYEKTVTFGEQLVDIRKLRMTQGLNDPVDISSDHVDITNFQIADMSQADGPETVQVEITVSSINPENYLDYQSILPIKTSLTFRNGS